MRLLKILNSALSRALLMLSGLLLTAMMLLAGSNMVLRAFGKPVQGTYELLGFMGAAVIAFGLAATQEKKGHIALTILAGMFPKHVERFIDMLSSLACSIFFALIAWRTARYALSLMASGEFSETLRAPYYPFTMAVAAGCGLLALTLFIDFVEASRPGARK